MKSISSDYLKIILILLFIFFAQSAFAEEKCALPHQLTDSSKKIHCLGKFDFSKRKYSNFNMTLDRAARASNCWSLAIPIEESCNNIIGFSAREPQWCMAKEMRIINNDYALSMCQFRGCKCSLVIEANDIVDSKLFFSYAMRETELVVHNNTEKEAKESINNKSELKNSQPENNQSIINTEKEKQIQLDLKQAQEAKAIEDVKAKAQQELKLAQEAKAKEDAISEARQKAQQELRQSQEAQARAAALEKLKEEEYQKEKNSAAAKARVLEEIKAEAYAKERAILEAKAKAQADLKAEEIAKIQAEEQAKAQAIIDEKNRVAAAKAAVEQAKKNREQEIAEEKTKIAESQKKIEELKNKPLDIENSKLDIQSDAAVSKPSFNTNTTKSEVKEQINFLLGLCVVSNIEWEKFKCNKNAAEVSDKFSVLFQTFNESNTTLELVFGSKCLNGPMPSSCNNKQYVVNVSYNLMPDRTIIMNTLAKGCSIPNKYSMENGILYLEYAGEAKGTCMDQQISAARQLKESGKQRIYFTKN